MASTGPPADPQHEPARQATILVVDDQASNRDLVRFTLADEGHRVLCAASGADALAMWAESPPDCVLLDIRMPDLDGFEVCARMRELPGGRDVPILFLTGLRDIDSFEHALAAGAVDYLTKPIKPSELLIRVETALRMRRLSAERDALYGLLRQQRDGLQRTALRNEQLSAFLVHDLKNPVSGMRAAARLLLSDPDASERTRDIAERMGDAADGLLRMIVNLLDIAKGDEGRLVVTPASVALPELVAGVFATLALRARVRDVALTADVRAPTLVADPDLVRRAVENLVDNAISHAPRGSTVVVSAERDGDGVSIGVRDSGAGVPPELRETIFDRFVQASPGSGRSGRGLGLAFCKLVVDGHGGRIWVEDGAPGALFRVWLPQP